MDLFTTLDDAPTYQVVAIAAPPQPEWLNLPEVHARLLPLAQAAGHEKLMLAVQIGNGLPSYEADGTGGTTGFSRYIGYFDWDSTPSQFECSLAKKLQQQASYLERNRRAA